MPQFSIMQNAGSLQTGVGGCGHEWVLTPPTQHPLSCVANVYCCSTQTPIIHKKLPQTLSTQSKPQPKMEKEHLFQWLGSRWFLYFCIRG